MKYSQLDHAACPEGHLTPIQPSTPQSVEAYRKAIETGTCPLFVACRECTRVYKVRQLHSLPPIYELEPFHEDAPLRRFQVSIPCDMEDCEDHAIVIAVRNADTSAEALIAELSKRRLDEMECPAGHAFPWPAWH